MKKSGDKSDKIVAKKRTKRKKKKKTKNINKMKDPPVIHAKKILLPDEWIAIDSGSSPVNLCTISHFSES
jgi:hypothetical protein